MARLRNPHPGEILKEEFLSAIGMSQNQLAHTIGVAGQSHPRHRQWNPRYYGRYRFAPMQVFWPVRRAISCGSRMPMTRWKPSAALQSRWPRSSPTSQVRRPRPMKAITLASHSDEIGRGSQRKRTEGLHRRFSGSSQPFSRSEDETEIRAGEGTGDAYPSVPRQPNGPRNRKTKPIIAAGPQ